MTDFIEWLNNTKGFKNPRTARDYATHLRRAMKILGDKEIDSKTISKLNGNNEFINLSNYQRSHIRGSIRYYLDYKLAKGI